MEQVVQLSATEAIPKNLEIEHSVWQFGKRLVAGVDEAGRGPLAGPVVAAAVIFPPYFYIPGVKDSKKLTPAVREALYETIQTHAVAYGIGLVEPEEIDRINIRQATFKAMRMALGQLKIQPDYVLFDGYELPEKIFQQEAVVHGDDLSFTIAAASILAKVYRDRLMVQYNQQYPRYGFARHKGYGTAQHREAIRRYGPCPIHRKSFLGKILQEDSGK